MPYSDNYQTLDTRLSGRRKNDQFFMNLVDAMNIGVAVTDCERKIIFLNKNFRAITGHSENNMIGLDLAEMFDYSNSQKLKKTYQDCLKNTRASAELCWQHSCGKQINAHISITAFETASQKNRLFFVAITDITEFKNAQKAVIHTENKYKAVVENSLTGLFIEQDSKIIFANQRLAEMLGFELNQLVGMEPHHFFQSANNGATEEIQTRRKDGTSIWIKLKSRRIAYQGNIAILCNVIEISREKMMENRLLDLELKLSTLSDKLQVDQENQRKKIAMEIHNGIGKSLTETKVLLEKAIAIQSDGSNVIEHLHKIFTLLKNATDEARRMTITLHPTILDDLGLKATIIWHCDQYQNIFPTIKISLIINFDESKLAETLKTSIYIIIQEALNNIAEHFGTTQVKIHLFASAGRLNLVVKDNGVSLSLNTDEADRPYRFGLGQSTIKERIRQTGGRCAFGKNHGIQGMYLYSSWPIDTA